MSEQRWAVVTGASSGIGTDIARELAKRGYSLLLTARRNDRLQALAEELRNAHRIEIECVPLDMALAESPLQLFERATARSRRIQVLVNNAGFGDQTQFIDQDWPRLQQMLHLNMTALTELCWLFVKHMRQHGMPSHLLNVASVGAWTPSPSFAVYAASKAYVRNFSEALSYELGPSNVSATCLCPGATATEFMEVAGYKMSALDRAITQSSQTVARLGVDAMLARKALRVTGWINHIITLLSPWVPRWLVPLIAAKSLNYSPKP